MTRALGRLEPKDYSHVSNWPLSARPPELPAPCALGTNWYSGFDHPQKDSNGRYWIGRGNLGYVRGGHCICIYTPKLKDSEAWHAFYDQGEEGACVGFGESRVMSLINRKRYDGFWLYHEAQKIDGWPMPHDGTSLDAGFEVLRKQGHRVAGTDAPSLAEGITAYRWATTVEEVHGVVQSPLADSLGAVCLENSWGASWPAKVWMPDEVLARMLDEGGEVGVIVDA